MDSHAAVKPAESETVRGRRAIPAPQTTLDVLVQLAAEVFASEGYASASVRDLARRASVTSGAIYGNFRGKADLLVEAVDARILTDLWTLPEDVVSDSWLGMVSYQFEHYQDREQLMSLLIEGAMAARTDPDVQARLKEIIMGRVDSSTASMESRRVAEGYADDFDASAMAKAIWSMEIGMRVLTALGVSGPDPADLAAVVRHFLLGLKVPDVRPAAAAPPKGKPKKRKAKALGKQ
jgi:AcrR family transcriptional regulator